MVYEEVSAESGYEAFFSGNFTIPDLPEWEDTETRRLLGLADEDEDLEEDSTEAATTEDE